jgi:UDP-apiose/xylose synthase
MLAGSDRPENETRETIVNVNRLVILGCGGFIGSHLLDHLFDRTRIEVEGWDLDDRKILHHLSNPRLRLHRTSVSDPLGAAALERAIVRSDAVINLAAICNPSEYNTRPLETIKGNFFDVSGIVETCSRHGKWLIHFSTSEVYGRTLSSYLRGDRYDDPALYELDEDTTPLVLGPIANQRWTYACAKQLMERLIYAHHCERGLPYTIVRPLNFFGPRMDYIPGRDGDGLPRVLACFMTALLDGTPLRLVDGGKARRTIVSVHEAVEAVLLMLARPDRARNQIFNIGNRDNEVTIAQLADRMRRTYARITGDPTYDDHPIEHVTGREFYGEGYEDCDRRMPRLDKARRLLGWIPRASLDLILDETMRHYREVYLSDSFRTGLSPRARPRRARAPRKPVSEKGSTA